MTTSRDKDRYEQICKQIEREDSLYNTRFNFWMLLNIALAAGASAAIQSSGVPFVRGAIFYGACLFGIAITFLMNELLQSGSAQIEYLRSEYWRGVEDKAFEGLPRPYFDGIVKAQSFVPKGWSGLPFVALFGWLLAGAVGWYILRWLPV